MIFLDTDICIELLRGNRKIIEKRIRRSDAVAVSFLTVGEIFYGAEKSSAPAKNRTMVEEFLLSVEIVHSDFSMMKKFGEIKALISDKGAPLPDADLLIAATVLCHGGLLVAGNTKHFRRIPGLEIENWLV